MRSITVYGRDDGDGYEAIGEHDNVTSLGFPPAGHLVVHTETLTWCYAAGEWRRFRDLHDDDVVNAEVVPDPQHDRLPDPFLSLGRAPFSAEVHQAMQILCVCAELRCRIVLNEAHDTERAWWRLRAKNHSPGYVQPVPMRQCVHDLGHDESVTPHAWAEGGWPFGPARHHQSCPRHPDAYNRPHTEEGQPHAVGLTSATAVAPERGLLVRPYTVASLSDEAQSGPGNLGRPQPPEGAINVAARDGWGYCAAWGPENPDIPKRLWCTRMPHADNVSHQHAMPGGDRVSW